MPTTAVNSWNAIKSRHEALRNDAKFKPDKLAPLCAKLDEVGGRLDKQKEEKENTEKIIDDVDEPIESRTRIISTRHDEIKQIADRMTEEMATDGELKSDNAVKVVSNTAAKFVNFTNEIAEAAQAIAKASHEQGAIIKKMAEQFKAKREAADAAIKKTQAEGTKTQEQIKKQIDAYRKIANDLKNKDLADALGGLQSMVAQLHAF
jgi:hypothetical protein